MSGKRQGISECLESGHPDFSITIFECGGAGGQGRGNRWVRKFTPGVKHGILTPPNFLERNIFQYTTAQDLHYNYIIF